MNDNYTEFFHIYENTWPLAQSNPPAVDPATGQIKGSFAFHDSTANKTFGSGVVYDITYGPIKNIGILQQYLPVFQEFVRVKSNPNNPIEKVEIDSNYGAFVAIDKNGKKYYYYAPTLILAGGKQKNQGTLKVENNTFKIDVPGYNKQPGMHDDYKFAYAAALTDQMANTDLSIRQSTDLNNQETLKTMIQGASTKTGLQAQEVNMNEAIPAQVPENAKIINIPVPQPIPTSPDQVELPLPGSYAYYAYPQGTQVNINEIINLFKLCYPDFAQDPISLENNVINHVISTEGEPEVEIYLPLVAYSTLKDNYYNVELGDTNVSCTIPSPFKANQAITFALGKTNIAFTKEADDVNPEVDNPGKEGNQTQDENHEENDLKNTEPGTENQTQNLLKQGMENENGDLNYNVEAINGFNKIEAQQLISKLNSNNSLLPKIVQSLNLEGLDAQNLRVQAAGRIKDIPKVSESAIQMYDRLIEAMGEDESADELEIQFNVTLYSDEDIAKFKTLADKFKDDIIKARSALNKKSTDAYDATKQKAKDIAAATKQGVENIQAQIADAANHIKDSIIDGYRDPDMIEFLEKIDRFLEAEPLELATPENKDLATIGNGNTELATTNNESTSEENPNSIDAEYEEVDEKTAKEFEDLKEVLINPRPNKNDLMLIRKDLVNYYSEHPIKVKSWSGVIDGFRQGATISTIQVEPGDDSRIIPATEKNFKGAFSLIFRKGKTRASATADVGRALKATANATKTLVNTTGEIARDINHGHGRALDHSSGK